MHGSSHSFVQLLKDNITSLQLYAWGAPIDVAEEYELYLQIRTYAHQTFYNCSRGFYGRFCEFEGTSFTDTITTILTAKSDYDDSLNEDILKITNGTCYIDLDCVRGPEPLCLDWREVWDGKVDCSNEQVDEKDYSVHDSICQVDEFLCKNGWQCVPIANQDVHIAYPQCLDGSDVKLNSIDYRFCVADLTFLCEDRTNNVTLQFTCGDGSIPGRNFQCARSTLFKNVLFSYQPYNSHISKECWSVMMDYLNIALTYDYDTPDCAFLDDICLKYIRKHCPSSGFLFPALPVVYEQLYLFHDLNNTWLDYIPLYICYNAQTCQLSYRMTFLLGLVCHLLTDIDKSFKWEIDYNWGLLHDSKFLTIFASCFLKNKTLVLKDTSLSIANNLTDLSLLRPSFFTMCDGFVDVNLNEFVRNRSTFTDEGVDCDQHWPCNNIYTRCDGYWNCKNGIDELNCSYNLCASVGGFECVDKLSHHITCLPLSSAGNDLIDCLGGTDEPFMCRNVYPHEYDMRYHCYGNSNKEQVECIETRNLCNYVEGDCLSDEDEMNCPTIIPHFGICHGSTFYQLQSKDRSYKLLCNLNEQRRIKHTLYFSLVAKREYVLQLESLTIFPIIKISSKKHNLFLSWYCNRGVFIENIRICLCPPAYYGNRCEFQNQRISLSFRVQTFQWNTVFTFVILLLDNQSQIHSYEQIHFLSMRDCNTRFDVYLLYNQRPKNLSFIYTIHIYAFEKIALFIQPRYVSKWIFSNIQSRLPVNRISVHLILPFERYEMDKFPCTRLCIHGRCQRYMNRKEEFCYCSEGWNGAYCEKRLDCQCTSDSLCIDTSLCVCSLGKFGIHCLLIDSQCQPNPCQHDSLCVPNDIRIRTKYPTCICKQGFTGEFCEHFESRLNIYFDKTIQIPSIVFIHLITIQIQAHPIRTTWLRKISFDQNSFILYTSIRFNLVFIEFQSEYDIENDYYLAFINEIYTSISNQTVILNSLKKCLSIRYLFNSSILSLPLIQRWKYYYIPCHIQSSISCFYDEYQLCLCTTRDERHTNCLTFNHSMIYNCKGSHYCRNNAQCFQDHPTCPTSMICSCQECFYGTQCQFNTQTFGLSLDAILGYQIQQHRSFIRQPLTVKMSFALTILIFILTLCNSILLMLTFIGRSACERGCGIYLLTSSLTSIITICLLLFKVLFLLFSQMNLITNRSIISFQCIIVDMLMKTFLVTSDWLHVCVAIERTITIMKGTKFKIIQSRQIAKYVIMILFILTFSTHLQDPIYRRLIDDLEEDRSWCIIIYSSAHPRLETYNSFINIFHFITPFMINVVSAFLIIITMTRRRSKLTQRQFQFQIYLKKQLLIHKHLFISPLILVFLALPRLILALIYGCMKSARDPWLFLLGYFISFIPSMLSFAIFVLPSSVYKKDCWTRLQRILNRIKSY